jgi:CRP/FNR family transcriptional regulator, cyclic AMP receptor protein
MRATEIVAGERSTTPAPWHPAPCVSPFVRTRPRLDGCGPEHPAGLLGLAARLADVTVTVSAGPWDPSTAHAAAAHWFTMLILDGVLLSELHLRGEPTAQLLLAGETLDPLACADRVLSSDRMTWTALEDATLAVLGARFLAATQRLPQLTAALCRQQAAQINRGMRYAAMTKPPRVEQRIIALFCAVAEEHGRVVGDGVQVELPLTYECLGRLIGAKRPTVSLALKTLAGDRLLTHKDKQWLLSRRLTASTSCRQADPPHLPPSHRRGAGAWTRALSRRVGGSRERVRTHHPRAATVRGPTAMIRRGPHPAVHRLDGTPRGLKDPRLRARAQRALVAVQRPALAERRTPRDVRPRAHASRGAPRCLGPHRLRRAVALRRRGLGPEQRAARLRVPAPRPLARSPRDGSLRRSCQSRIAADSESSTGRSPRIVDPAVLAALFP